MHDLNAVILGHVFGQMSCIETEFGGRGWPCRASPCCWCWWERWLQPASASGYGKNAPTSDAGEAALSRSGVNAALRYRQLRDAPVAVLARLFQGHHTNGANPGIPASPRLPARSDFAANPPASRRSSTVASFSRPRV